MARLCQIKASAGSGKTFALTQLFLQKLNACGSTSSFFSNACPLGKVKVADSRLSDILAITFTNAAASEMRNRVLGELKKLALGGKSPIALKGMDQAWAMQMVDGIMRSMSALNIRTIDSLLHQIVRTAALELGLSPDFEPAFGIMDVFGKHFEALLDDVDEYLRDQEDGKLTDKSAVSTIGARSFWGQDERRAQNPVPPEQDGNSGAAGESGDFAQAHDLLLKICTQIVEKEGSKGFLLGDKLEENVKKCLENLYAGIFDDLTREEDYQKERERLTARLMESTNTLLQAASRAGIEKNWKARALNALEAIAGGDLEKCSSKSIRYEAEGLFKKNTQIPQDFYQALEDFSCCLNKVPGLLALLEKGSHFAPFIKISRLLADRYEANQGRENLLPAYRVPWLAKRVMEDGDGVPAALCRMGTLLSHFLVDEFQDTSRIQWEAMNPLVVEALSRGGSFTWVGDVKQSIYAWRGGDAELFDEILAKGEHLLSVASSDRESVQLECNWRSHEQIISFNNRLFSTLEDPGNARELLETIVSGADASILDSMSKRLSRIYAGVSQQFSASTRTGGMVVIEPVLADKADEMKLACAERTVQLVGDIAARRKASGSSRPLSDILILVRKNESTAFLTRELTSAGIDFVTENSLLLSEHPLVSQTVAFLRFLADPADNTAFLHLVSGPAISTHPEFAREAGWQDLAELGLSRPAQLFAAFKQTWSGLWERFFARHYSQAGLKTAYDLVMDWYVDLDLERRFASESTYLRRFMEVLHAIGERGPATIRAFLDYWGEHGNDEKVPMPENMNAVRIMTIHKAKGLEAPVVIVPMASFGPGKTNTVDRFEADGVAVAMPNCKDLGHFYYQARVAGVIEEINNLYVAFTRPREELYILPDMKNPGDKSILSCLLAAAGQDLECHIGEPVQDIGKKAAGTGKPRPLEVLQRRPANTVARAADEGDEKKDLLTARLRLNRNHLRGNLRADERGTMIHMALELMLSGGDPEQDAENAMARARLRLGLPGPAAAEDLACLTWFASQPFAASWLREARREQGLVDASGNYLRMDLLLRQPWGYLVVDYKTGEISDEHVSQVRRYLAVMGQIVKQDKTGTGRHGKRVLGLLVYLDRQAFRLVTPDGLSGLCPHLPWPEHEADILADIMAWPDNVIKAMACSPDDNDRKQGHDPIVSQHDQASMEAGNE